MKKNMGATDRTIRTLLAVVFILLSLNGAVNGYTEIILLVLSGVFLLTSFIGYCPLYAILGFSTRKKESEPS